MADDADEPGAAEVDEDAESEGLALDEDELSDEQPEPESRITPDEPPS